MQLELAPLYGELIDSESSLVSIEHAPLECRILESLLALAYVLPGVSVAIVPSIDRATFHLKEWTPGIKAAFRAPGMLSFHKPAGSGTIWIVSAKGDRVDDLPFWQIDHAIIVQAHTFKTDVVSNLIPRSKSIVVSGLMTPRSHWFYEFGRREDVNLIRMTAEKIGGSFPDQSDLVPAKRDKANRRLFHLEDVEVRGVTSFSLFARERLRVRTDKGKAFLSEAQQKEAEAKLGPAWWTGRNGMPVITLELSPLQRQYITTKRRARRNGYSRFLVLKYRRGGITTIEQAESYASCVVSPQTQVQTIAHREDASKRIFRIAKLYQQHDPERIELLGDSKTSLDFENGSTFVVGTPGAAARGDTLSRFHGSEVSRWFPGPRQLERIDDFTAGVLGAASHGEVVYETTAAGHDWFYHKWEEAKRGENDWFPLFLPWFADPSLRLREGAFSPEKILDTLTDQERFLMNVKGLDVSQIAFRRSLEKEHGYLAPQEYPEDDESCFLATGTLFMNPVRIAELIRAVETREKETPRRTKNIPGGVEITWEDPDPKARYTLGHDCSEGLPGCCPNGLGVIRTDTKKQVFEVHGLLSIDEQAKAIARTYEKFNRRMIIGVEQNNMGYAVISKLIDMGLGDSHHFGGPLYYHGPKPATRVHNRNDMKAKAGWVTNSVTRDRILDGVRTWVEEDHAEERVMSREFLSECLTFRLQSDGKFRGDSGATDDRVLKWAIALEMTNHRRVKPGIVTL